MSDEWRPTRILEFEESIETSMRPAIVYTDAGRAYVKPLHDKVSDPLSLACDLVGIRAAEWFGLVVPRHAVLELEEDAFFYEEGGPRVRSGPALATRAIEHAQPWDGTPATLKRLANPEHVAGLVLLDIFLRQDDRYPPLDAAGNLLGKGMGPNANNVLMDWSNPRQIGLVAIDFGRAFGGGHPRGCHGIDQIQDDQIYGLWPAFRGLITRERLEPWLGRLRSFDNKDAAQILRGIPAQWDWNASCGESAQRFLVERARWLSSETGGGRTIVARLIAWCDGADDGRLFDGHRL